jgi:hypothetical protein
MVSKRELYKIAIASAATIFMIVNIVNAVDGQTVENTTIIWNNATDICQGIPLSYDQLDASAVNATTLTALPGTFYYHPNVGTVLSEGQHQPLDVTFVPGEDVVGAKESKTVYINVTKCPEKPGFFHQTEYSTFLPFQWG